jgi:hypothetical protein
MDCTPHGSTSTQRGWSPAEVIGRVLLRELVQGDKGRKDSMRLN